MKQHGKNISGNTWNQCHSLYVRANWTSLIQFNEIGSICFIGFNEVSFVSFLPTTILCINLASATMLKLWDVFVWIFSFKEWVTFVARLIKFYLTSTILIRVHVLALRFKYFVTIRSMKLHTCIDWKWLN